MTSMETSVCTIDKKGIPENWNISQQNLNEIILIL